MSYIEKTLANDESVAAEFNFHWIEWLWFAFWILLAIPTIGITLLFAIYAYLRIKCTEQAVTNHRVVFKKGIISRHTEEMRLKSVETVEVRQSVFGRVLGYGNIKVTGRGVSDVILKHLRRPLEAKRAIENALQQE